MSLRIALLGSFEVWDSGHQVNGFLSDKVRGLLAYTVCEYESVIRREKLAALLWPAKPEEKARANLRRALNNLRCLIGDDKTRCLQITRQTIRFCHDCDAEVDYFQYQNYLTIPATSISDVSAATTLYRGPFLDGFSLSDSTAFEQWAVQKRQSLHYLQGSALNRLSSYYQSFGQFELALDYAWQFVHLEPWHEPGVRRLMQLLALTGQRAQAIIQYKALAHRLWADLKLQPEAATQHLYAKLSRADRVGKRPSPDA